MNQAVTMFAYACVTVACAGVLRKIEFNFGPDEDFEDFAMGWIVSLLMGLLWPLVIPAILIGWAAKKLWTADKARKRARAAAEREALRITPSTSAPSPGFAVSNTGGPFLWSASTVAFMTPRPSMPTPPTIPMAWVVKCADSIQARQAGGFQHISLAAFEDNYDAEEYASRVIPLTREHGKIQTAAGEYISSDMVQIVWVQEQGWQQWANQ